MSSRFDKILEIEKELNKKFETTNSLIRLGDKVGVKIPSFPTNLANLDHSVLGVGGVPKGRLIELYGPESAGKTALALHIIGQNQKAGGLCAFLDLEQSFDPTFASILGVNVDDLLVSQPDYGEMALTTLEHLVDSGIVTIVVVDSIAAIVPKSELDGEIGDSHMGLVARMMSQTCRILTPKCKASGCSVIFLNQLRDKIGVVFGNPEVTTGGKALKFYASIRLDIRRSSQIKENDELVGHIVKIKCIKNKTAKPFNECFINLRYDSGFDIDSSVIDWAVEQGVVESSGGWFSFGGKKYRREGLLGMLDEIKKELDKPTEPMVPSVSGSK